MNALMQERLWQGEWVLTSKLPPVLNCGAALYLHMLVYIYLKYSMVCIFLKNVNTPDDSMLSMLESPGR